MKHMKSILISLVLLAFVSCSSDPVFHGMTNQQKEDYAKAVSGEYTGTYVIYYSDGSSDAKREKIEGAQVSISDQTMQSVFFHAFPVSRLSQVVKDPALAEALASLPDMDFTAIYHFFDLQDNGDVSWGYNDFTIPLTLHVDDADRHLLLKVSNASTYYRLTKANMDAGTPFANQDSFELQFDGIYEGSTPIEDFSVWQDGNAAFLVFFQIDNKG
jgi:hypothetical protein